MSKNDQFYPPYMQDPSIYPNQGYQQYQPYQQYPQQVQYPQQTQEQPQNAYTEQYYNYANCNTIPSSQGDFLNSYMDELNKKIQKKAAEKELVSLGLLLGATTICYLLFQVFAMFIFYAIPGLYAAYDTSSAVQNCSNLIIVHIFSLLLPFSIMYLIAKKHYVHPLVPTKKLGFKNSLGWVAFGIGCCVVSDFIVGLLSMISQSLGYELTQGSLLEPDSVFACVAIVFSTVLAPAVIEEFAFRCCSLGLLRKYGKGFAVVIVSIFFGLIHGNIIQFIFATLVGLILGYITVKTDNVVVAMVVHGLNNSMSVVSDIVKYASNEQIANTVSSVMMFVFIPIGIVGAVYLWKNGLLFKKKQAPTYQVLENGMIQAIYPPTEESNRQDGKSEVKLSLGKKILCILPGLAISSPYFIYSIITTIVKS